MITREDVKRLDEWTSKHPRHYVPGANNWAEWIIFGCEQLGIIEREPTAKDRYEGIKKYLHDNIDSPVRLDTLEMIFESADNAIREAEERK